MSDEEIVDLYWRRDQAAIPATAEKYGAYCTCIAMNILAKPEDAEECVNDTYLRAWSSIPPHRPAALAAFLAKITRNLAFDYLRRSQTDKRGGGAALLPLEELGGCVTGSDDTARGLDEKELVREINAFLDALPAEKRDMFVCRYWYCDGISDIAGRFRRTEGSVLMTLMRLRRKLREHLNERGFEI